MIPLALLWGRWLWRAALRCGLDLRKWGELWSGSVALELTAVEPIEVATLFWMTVTAFCACIERSAKMRIRLIGVRSLHPFAWLTLLGLAEELYLRFWHRQYFASLPWRCVVAYVASNHFLFGMHNVLGRGVNSTSHAALQRVQQVCEHKLERVACHTRMKRASSLRREGVNVTSELADVGGKLRDQQQRSYGLLGAIWSFNEHRLADVWVHFGVFVQCPYRLDHLLALVLHLTKYSGNRHRIPRILMKPLFNGSLSLDNFIDVVAHSASGVMVLGPGAFALAVLGGEIQRWLLDAEKASHHMYHAMSRSNSPERADDVAVCKCAAKAALHHDSVKATERNKIDERVR